VLEQLLTGAGRLLTEQLTELDDTGNIRSRKGPGSPDESWRYAPDGGLIAIERGEVAWVWADDLITGTDGELLLLDDAGRIVEARLSDGEPVWGVGRRLLSAFWDEAGRLSEVSGEGGVVFPQYDPIGRLTGVRGLDGAQWGLAYDARGRLSEITSPDGTTRNLSWPPEAFDRWWEGIVDTPISDGQPILSVPGAVLTAQGGWLDLIGGDRWWAGEAPDGSPTQAPIIRTPMGLSADGRDGLIASDGGLRPFPGGPIILGGTAIEPVSGGRLDGLTTLPWATRSVRADPRATALDPEPWAPQARWGEPLAILTAFGELASVDAGDWLAVDPLASAVYWLPPSMEGGQPPLGPAAGWLPMAEDPITEALLRAILPGGTPPAPGIVLDAVLDEEREVHGIPPGIYLSWFSDRG
jgi:YD repeat-containing protein